MRVAFAALLLAGCFGPSLTEGLPCTEWGGCPEGQGCVPGQDVCLAGATPMALDRIVAGDDATCGVTLDGDLYCWGRNDEGQLGLGDTEDRDRPHLGDDAIDSYRDVKLGHLMLCVIDPSNNLFCAGEQFADVGGSPTLAEVAAGNEWRSVGVGDDAMCAVNGDGDVWCAREGGDAFAEEHTGFGFTGIVYEHGVACALDGESHLWCWGVNSEGQVGNGASDPVDEPYMTGGDDTWTDVDVGWFHVCARRTDGTVWCWGNNDDGQLGDGTFDESWTPQQVPGLTSVVDVDVGHYHSCAVDGGGRTTCWGEGLFGQIGDGRGDFNNLEPRELDVQLATISAGRTHTCGIDLNGGAWCWGDDGHGQLGDGQTARIAAPFDMGVGDDWDTVSVGFRHACGVTSVGLQCFGRNGHGQIGDGTTRRKLVPAVIDALDPWEQVAAGLEHSCALKAAGRISCWGSNRYLQLGLPREDEDRLVPTDVGDRDDWRKLAVGARITCAIDADTELWCWGDGEMEPQLVPGGPGWTDVSGTSDPRASYAAAIRGGAMFQVGPSTSEAISPATTDWTSVTHGATHSCGMRSGGEVWCAGENASGQLGDGTTDPAAEAVRAGDDAGWTSIAAGGEFTCGLQGDALSCWGRNDYGQVGIADAGDEVTPPGAVSAGWARVATGAHTACALAADGRLSCWGINLMIGGGWDTPVWVAQP